MTPRVNLEIAGISFNIIVSLSKLSPSTPAFYKPFLNLSGRHSDLTITVETTSGQIPEMDDAEIIFHSNESWDLYRRNNLYLVTLHSPVLDQPLWIASADSNFSNMKIILNEKVLEDCKDDLRISNPIYYPLDQIAIMYVLSFINGIIVHGAGGLINDTCLIFPGRSGAGKSTLAKILEKMKENSLFSDERIVLRQENGIFHAYGTPWPGEAGIARNESGPLKGIFFLYKSGESFVRELSQGDALRQLIPVASIPWYDRDVTDRVLQTCEDIVKNIPAFELHFRPDETVLREIETALRKLG